MFRYISQTDSHQHPPKRSSVEKGKKKGVNKNNVIINKKEKMACTNLIKDEQVLSTFKNFFVGLPAKIRLFFIGAFLVSNYRPEWGMYVTWNPKYPSRTKDEVEAKKKRKRAKDRKLKDSAPKKAIDGIPRPLPHNHAECLIVRINVSGKLFEPQVRTLQQFPKTLLGNPARMMRFYDPERDEFFFDRHRTSFEAIFSYYQTGGVIRKPSILGLDQFLDEVKFFDLGQDVIKFLEDLEGVISQEDNLLPENLLKRKLWLLFEHPDSSYQARILASLSVLAVCLSIVEFCIETMDVFCWQNKQFDKHGKPIATDKGNDENIFDLSDPFFLTDTICVAFFVVEYVIRGLMSPNIFQFVKKFANLIDLVAIIPYFVNLANRDAESIAASECGTPPPSSAGTLTIFRIIRLVRVFRIFKLSRHNRGLKILGKTLKASVRELGLLVFFLLIGVVVFSSAMYFAESSSPDSPFSSIPTGFWFSIVTMTTLGYGDMVPTTIVGKVVGALCAITGVLTLSLPVPVIVSNFNMFYSREELTESNIITDSNHVEHCPFLSGWYNSEGTFIGKNLPSITDPLDSACLQWLIGEQKPDYSDTDFEELKTDEVFKKVERSTLFRRRRKSRINKVVTRYSLNKRLSRQSLNRRKSVLTP